MAAEPASTFDTAMHRKTIAEMTDDEYDAFLEPIRKARLRNFNVYQEAQEAKKKIQDERARAKLEKKLATFKKHLDGMDKWIDKAEKYALEIRALRLQLGVWDASQS